MRHVGRRRGRECVRECVSSKEWSTCQCVANPQYQRYPLSFGTNPLGFLNAAPRPHRGFDRASDRERAYLSSRVHRSRRLPSRARVRSRVVGRTALKTAGLWCTVLVGGRPNEMEGESARPVRATPGVSQLSRQQFTNDEAAAHPPPPRHLRLLRRRVRARAADGAADPVRPACHPAADRGPTVCGAGSTHVHRAIDARTGGGAAAGDIF